MRTPAGLFRGLPKPFIVLWVGTFINRLGGFVVPFLAIYLTQTKGYSIERVGLIASMYGAGSFASSPVGGWLADRVGRKPAMLCSLCMSAAAVLCLAWARGGLEVPAAVFCIGLFGGMYAPASSAAVVDLVGPAQRTRAFGLIYWAVNLGFSAAMSLAGILIGYGYMVLFVADAATTLLFALLVALFVPETRPSEAGHAAPSLTAPFRDGRFVAFFLLMFAASLIYMQSTSTLPVDMRAHGIPAAQYGYLIALNGVLVAVLQPLAGRWIMARPAAAILAAGTVLTGVGFGLHSLTASAGFYAAAITIWTLGEILCAPVAPSVVAHLAPPALRGTYQGAFTMAWASGGFLAPALGGLFMGRFGSRALWFACLGLGLATAAGHLRWTGRLAAEGKA